MDALKRLLARCKCGVFLTVNEHRDYYENVHDFIADRGDLDKISPSVLQAMIETNTIIELQFYPDTPVGFYVVWHHDIDAALEEAMSCLEETGTPHNQSP